MKAPKKVCKCGCGTTLKGGRADREFVSAAHRQRHERGQPLAQAKQVAARVSVPAEFAQGIALLARAAKSLHDVATSITNEVGPLLLARLQGMQSPDAAERADFAAEGLSSENRVLGMLVKLATHALDDVEQARAVFEAGELGDAGDVLLLSLLATVPGLELAADGDELAGENEEGEA